MDKQDKRQQWLDEAETMRAGLAPAGVAGREQLRSISGMEFLKGIGSGAIPPAPIAELLGITPISVEPGLALPKGGSRMRTASCMRLPPPPAWCLTFEIVPERRGAPC